MKPGRGSDTRFLEPVREDLLTACLKDFYLVRSSLPWQPCSKKSGGALRTHQRPAPNYRTVVRRVEGLDPGYVMAKRQGSKRAREKFGPVGVSTLISLDVVQIDHTLVAGMLGDREHRQSIGRPWLTLAVEVASRAVVGFSVCLENPSALSISLVLSRGPTSIRTKTYAKQ